MHEDKFDGLYANRNIILFKPTGVYNLSFSLHMKVKRRAEIALGHPGNPGQLGHILPGSTRPDLLYKISGSDQDSA